MARARMDKEIHARVDMNASGEPECKCHKDAPPNKRDRYSTNA